MRTSMRLSMTLDDEDDYDLEAMGVSDGFRPNMVDHDRTPSQPAHDQQPHTTNMFADPPPRPSSMTKPSMSGRDSFSLQHDGASHVAGLRPVGLASSSARPASISSQSSSASTFIASPESPYLGPVAPSHQYQAFPQDTRLARTASVTTTSTGPLPERRYTGPRGPTHPYGMYPQNIVPEPESVQDRLPNADIPVGFPGLESEYHRRLGPEGEEAADIIGPDGHTEQLPPYTRFADEAFARKHGITEGTPIGEAAGSRLATHDPESESRDDLQSPQSRGSLVSDASNHSPTVVAMDTSEKPQLKKWQMIARRKAWGIIPIWVIVLVAAIFLLFGIILGSVLGALAPGHHKRPHVNNNGTKP